MGAASLVGRWKSPKAPSWEGAKSALGGVVRVGLAVLVDSAKTIPGALVLEVGSGVWSLPPSVQFRFSRIGDQTIWLSLLYHDFVFRFGE